jgi:hypothetical protein
MKPVHQRMECLSVETRKMEDAEEEEGGERGRKPTRYV